MNKKQAIINLKLSNPSLTNQEIADSLGCSRRHVRRAVKEHKSKSMTVAVTQTSEETLVKSLLMTGLKQKVLPKFYREMVANLVSNVEMALERPPLMLPQTPYSGKESANLLISDTHFGKIHLDESGNILYNKDIAAFKMELLGNQVVKLLTKHLRFENIDAFNIMLLGDIVDGSGIYPNQELNQDLSAFTDQVTLATVSIWNIVRMIRSLGLPVNLYGIPGNHGRCLSENMELLTDKGWKSWKELKVGMRVPTFKKKTGEVEYQEVEQVHYWNTDEYLWKLSNHEYEGLEVTEDHNIVYWETDIREYDCHPLSHLFEKRTRIYIPKLGYSHNEELDIPDALIEFMGYALSHIKIDSPDFVLKHDSIRVNKKLKDLLNILGVNAKLKYRMKQRAKLIKEIEILDDGFKELLVEMLPKNKIQPWMWDLSDRQTRLLLDGICLEDRARTRKDAFCRERYTTFLTLDILNNKEFLDELQALCVTHGVAFTHRECKNGYFTLHTPKSYTYRVPIEKFDKIPYGGNTWCVSVKNETIFVRDRRSNSVYIVGNTHKYAPASNNFDYMVYQLLYLISRYEDPENVLVHYSTTTPYLNLNIKNHKVHIRHSAPAQAETAQARAVFGGWASIHEYNTICFAHLHHPGHGTFMKSDILMNGSPVGSDDLSELMAVGSRPSQTLFGIDNDWGLTFRYAVYLDRINNYINSAEKLLKRYPKISGIIKG